MPGLSGPDTVAQAFRAIGPASRPGALVLVPEISLTPQMIERFRLRYGDRVAVLHSGLSLSQRMDEWRRAQKGLADVVVGTRSAVFAPVRSLGLIVVDEEQERTYRSESAPRFDARQAAMARMRYHKGLLLLSSATPSVESYYQALRGDYALVTLKERYGGAALPDVTILDMASQEVPAEGLSQELCQELYDNLRQGEQSILLVNRRGHSTQVACIACRLPVECPNCSVSMKYHAANERLMCHYCGFSQPVPEKCPHCGSPFIRYSGFGTQKLEEILKERLPEARILRMDLDTTMRRFSHQRFLDAFAAREYDILVGTQMVAKGLDFPWVTLVGVVGVDQMLYSENFRSFERVFSLVTQVVGRSGRRKRPGRAFLQTYAPENPVLAQAAAQEYGAFFREEIISRKNHLYPPFCRLYGICVTGEDLEKVRGTAGRLLELLTQALKERAPRLPVRLLGPTPGTVARVAGRHRYKILMKTNFSKTAKALLAGLLEQGEREAPKGVAVFIDPDYDSF
jgi:primosomal protein N' (replication factor Y)